MKENSKKNKLCADQQTQEPVTSNDDTLSVIEQVKMEDSEDDSKDKFLKKLCSHEFPENDNEISFFLDLTGDILWKDEKEFFEDVKKNLKKYDASTKQNNVFLCHLAEIIQLFPALKSYIINTVYVMCLKKLG